MAGRLRKVSLDRRNGWSARRSASRREAVVKGFHLRGVWVLAAMVAGLAIGGCKSAPDLTQDQALALIQAQYDQAAPQGASISVSDLGMRQGISAKYWDRTKVYPNKFWADFKLTDEGKKVIKLPGGGDTIQWRPDNADDKNYSVVILTVAANHLKAHDIETPHDETLPGVETARGATFVEGVNLDGVPGPLQDIAHDPGNKLSAKRQADFELANGAWKLHGIQ